MVTGRYSGLDFRGIHIERGVGFEYLSPTVSHPRGLDSSDLIRGSLRFFPGYPTVGFSVMCRCSPDVFPHGVFVFGGGMRAPFPDSLTFSFILACVCCPSFTCRVDLYKTDICPISPIPELLGMVDKVEEYGFVRCRVLSGKGSKDNFAKIF